MRAITKVSPARLPQPAEAVRRGVFPAWIDSEQGLGFSHLVTPRVRDGLILRLVAKRNFVSEGKGPHARGSR